MDFFITELCGNIACGNFERKTLCDCGFTYTGFTDEAGVILRSSAKNLDCSVNLVFSADNTVYIARLCFCCEVGAELRKILAFLFILLTVFVLSPSLFLFFAACCFGSGIFFAALGIATHCTEILEKRHCSCAARFESAVFAEHRFELLAHIFKFILGNAHALHNLLDGADVHFHCTLDAKTFLGCFFALNLCYKKHCRAFLTFCT